MLASFGSHPAFPHLPRALHILIGARLDLLVFYGRPITEVAIASKLWPGIGGKSVPASICPRRTRI
jgi:hypothetical protein